MTKFLIAAVGILLATNIAPALAQVEAVASADAGAASRSNARLWVTPALRSWSAKPGTLVLGRRSRILVPAGAPDDVRSAAEMLARDLGAVAGFAPPVVSGGPAAAGDIRLSLGGTRSSHAEGYELDFSDVATVRARTSAGLFYGTQSLLQMLEHDPKGRALPQGSGTDWPDVGMRSMSIDVGRKYFKVSALDNQMRELAWLKMNTVHLHFNDWPAFRLNSPRFPGLADEQSYNRDDIAHLEATARRYHITIIPEIDLPAHASALIRYRPSLAFKCEALRQSPWLTHAAGERAKDMAWVVDITRQENRDWMKALIGEFIPWFSGPYFHIGGDEYNYDVDKNRCPELLSYTRDHGFKYPGDVFVDWINEANKAVRAQGKTTVIWNWWRFKDDQTSIQPDPNIVIDVWNSPRLADIVASGYKVIVSPEDKLYVVPGIENFDGSNYGVVDIEAEYDTLPIERGPNVLGYALALWSDGAEHRTDTALLGRAYEPMAVLAERLWSDRGSPTLKPFLARLNRAGLAPRPGAAPAR